MSGLRTAKTTKFYVAAFVLTAALWGGLNWYETKKELASYRLPAGITLNCVKLNVGPTEDKKSVVVWGCPHPQDPHGWCLYTESGDVTCGEQWVKRKVL
jgi:hypothetical protein